MTNPVQPGVHHAGSAHPAHPHPASPHRAAAPEPPPPPRRRKRREIVIKETPIPIGRVAIGVGAILLVGLIIFGLTIFMRHMYADRATELLIRHGQMAAEKLREALKSDPSARRVGRFSDGRFVNAIGLHEFIRTDFFAEAKKLPEALNGMKVIGGRVNDGGRELTITYGNLDSLVCASAEAAKMDSYTAKFYAVCRMEPDGPEVDIVARFKQ